MKGARWAAAVLAVASGLGTGGIAHAESFDVPPGRLGDVVAKIGARAGVTIAVTDPDLAARRSPGVRGDISVRTALVRALRGTGAEAVFYDSVTIRIVRRRAAPKPVRQQPPLAPAPIAEPPDEIIVTASKQNSPLDSNPGSVKVVETDDGWTARNGAEGTAAITRLIPSIGTTNLGPGRDKLFIRGIADSSFSGPTQATTGQYLGDVRLTYNAPDPDLNLYDMQRIEVLVGPQGALYGAGSLGGVIRLVPNAPDMDAMSATASANTGVTRYGGVSWDGAGMLNLPFGDGQVSARLVVFGGRKAGYIDAPAQGRRDINTTLSYGQRFALRAQDISGWTIDLGYILQNISSDDGQYTLRGGPPLTRDTPIPQPFRNNYRLGYVTASRSISEAELVSTTSVARHHLRTVFDASGLANMRLPVRFEEDNDITLLSHETRLSGGSRRAPWVGGISVLYSSSDLLRSIALLDGQGLSVGVVNRQAEAALFGQISHPLSRTLTGTIGGRLTLASSRGFVTEPSIKDAEELSRHAARFSSTAALDWHPGGRFSAFFHYQQGYRAGGLVVAPTSEGVFSQRFVPDDLYMYELGIRLGDKKRDRLSIRAAIFFADWRNMQADLISGTGIPYTANIGRGMIRGLDGELTWRPSSALTFSAAAFLNDSKLVTPEPEFVTESKQRLPNISGAGGRVAVEWRQEISQGLILTNEASVRYVGKSSLGVGPDLNVPQGNYFVVDIGARLDFGRFTLSARIDNAGDARGNSFAFGNPFELNRRDQMTPLRPRTFRFGFDAAF